MFLPLFGLRCLISLSLGGIICDLLLLTTQSFYFATPLLFPNSCIYFVLPRFRSSVLCEFDKCLCSIVSTITNVSMSISDVAWKRATLPVWAGGLGFRSAIQLAPSGFLASATAATPISILHCSSSVVPEVDCALTHWSVSESLTPPVGDDAHLQRAWDIPHIKSTLNSLLEIDHAPNKARLFSVSTLESGAWLKGADPGYCDWQFLIFFEHEKNYKTLYVIKVVESLHLLRKK